MTDTPVQFPGEQQVEGGTPAAAPEKATQPEHLTKADLQEAFTEWNRQQQALRAKQDARQQKRFAKMIEAAQRANVEVTPQLRQSFADSAAQEEDEPEQAVEQKPAKPKPEPTVQQQPQASDINAVLREMDTEAGFAINQDDPEAKTLDASSPRKFVKSYEAALQAKAQRVTSEPNNPASRMSTVGGGGIPIKDNPIEKVTDSQELISMGLKGPPKK